MKRALIVATTTSVIKLFNTENILILISLGYKVDIATNLSDYSYFNENERDSFNSFCEDMNIGQIDINFSRNILNLSTHINNYKKLKKLSNNTDYDIVHFHTPTASFIGRLAFRKSASYIVYTAHGFHFYKNAHLINWIIFYSLEKYASRLTNTLITINKEDYNLAKSKFRIDSIFYVPGIGIDFKRLESTKSYSEMNLGLDSEDFILLSVGELNANKNHEVVIRALSKLNNTKIKYIICGNGKLKNKLLVLANKLNVEKQVMFTGFVSNVEDYYRIANVFVFPSFREGLPVSVMEAMYCKLPVICSDIRGSKDLIFNNQGGYLVKPSDYNDLSNKINLLYNDEQLRKSMGIYNHKQVQKYSKENINNMMLKIYEKKTEI